MRVGESVRAFGDHVALETRRQFGDGRVSCFGVRLRVELEAEQLDVPLFDKLLEDGARQAAHKDESRVEFEQA